MKRKNKKVFSKYVKGIKRIIFKEKSWIWERKKIRRKRNSKKNDEF